MNRAIPYLAVMESNDEPSFSYISLFSGCRFTPRGVANRIITRTVIHGIGNTWFFWNCSFLNCLFFQTFLNCIHYSSSLRGYCNGPLISSKTIRKVPQTPLCDTHITEFRLSKLNHTRHIASGWRQKQKLSAAVMYGAD